MPSGVPRKFWLDRWTTKLEESSLMRWQTQGSAASAAGMDLSTVRYKKLRVQHAPSILGCLLSKLGCGDTLQSTVLANGMTSGMNHDEMMTFDDATFLSTVLTTYNNMSAWKPGENTGWICALEQMAVSQHNISDECVDLMFKIMGEVQA
eukprot:3356561-Amphidinium_carterae.1